VILQKKQVSLREFFVKNSVYYGIGGDFMDGYLFRANSNDVIENMKAHEDEMSRMIDELRAENVRLTQLLRDYDEGAK
jgi:hypothetical protein